MLNCPELTQVLKWANAMQDQEHMENPPPDAIQTLINWLFVVGGAFVTWYTDSVRRRMDKSDDRVSQLERQQHQTALILAGDYVKRSELDSISRAIFDKLDRIEEKIDRKADKPN